nr:hypothetical protein [Candidatus Sigynarchaeota archaeon]
MNKIHFTIFSQSYYIDAQWGFGCPSGGIRNFGDLCHKHKLPVTWLVSPKSARCEQDMFTEYHEKFGDEIAMFFRFPTGEKFHHSKERDIATKLTVDDYRKLLRDQKAEVQKWLPWADIKVAGQGIRTDAMYTALEAEGFIGMFGHCYCQIGTDSITDFGMPWGSFPMRKGSSHLPADAMNDSGIVAFEWTQRDLNKSFHTCFPELWSTDPNDVERGGVCTDTNVEYWKNLVMEYEKALPLNDHGIWFQFHQEAHEQTWGEICKPFTEARVVFCTKMMDLFFEWLAKRDDVEFLTATPAAQLYKKAVAKGTIPMHVPFKWVDVPKDLDFWRQVRDGKDYAGQIHKNARLPVEYLYDYLNVVNGSDRVKAMESPPWMDSYFYFDAECQLVFDEGRPAPVAIFNYVNFEPDPDMPVDAGGGAPGFYLDPLIPSASVEVSISKQITTIRLRAENPRSKALPYGIFLWESAYPGVVQSFKGRMGIPRAVWYKVSPGQGVFVRWTLQPGKNDIVITGK